MKMLQMITKNNNEAQYVVSGRLHTDALQEIYGPIHVQVLNDDNLTREVLLTDQQHIARTYAFTVKNDDWAGNEDLKAVNNEIYAGAAIGKAFRDQGFCICKNIVDVYLTELPVWLQHAFEHDSPIAKARVSEFLVKKHQLIFNYGLITEIYSPDFRHPIIHPQDTAQVNLPAEVLYDMGFTRQQVWKYVKNKALAAEPELIRWLRHNVRTSLREGESLLQVC